MKYYVFSVVLKSGIKQDNVVVAAHNYEEALRILYFGDETPEIDGATLSSQAIRKPKNAERIYRLQKENYD